MMLTSKGALIILRLLIIEIFIIMILIKAGNSLKCRTEDGPSDGELKRVARACMRKFGDVAFVQNSQQQQQSFQQGRHRSRVMNRDNYGYNYEDSDEADEEDFEDQYYNNNNNNNNRNYHRQKNGSNNNNNNERDGFNGGIYNRPRSSGNNNNNNNNNRSNSGNGYSNNNWNYSNQRNNMGYSPNNRGPNGNRNKNNNNSSYNSNTTSTDTACIVHCFFEEMHMLNNQNYPDRHKMLYILTKDLRDRELRNFYTDTIQECFRYLETQKRRDMCKFSRDLISCMTEYAKGNCDDWNEFSMIFN